MIMYEHYIQGFTTREFFSTYFTYVNSNRKLGL